MIIDINRILRAFVYTIILGIIVSVVISFIPNYAVYYAASGLCSIVDLYIWWWCFFGTSADPFFMGRSKTSTDWGKGWDNNNGFGGGNLTEPTKTFVDGPGPNTIALNRMVRVVLTNSDGKTQTTLKIDPQAIRAHSGYTLGSSPNCDFQINDRSIAPVHARLYAAGEILCIENIGSNNGVQIDGKYLDYKETASFPKVGTIYLGGAKLEFLG